MGQGAEGNNTLRGTVRYVSLFVVLFFWVCVLFVFVYCVMLMLWPFVLVLIPFLSFLFCFVLHHAGCCVSLSCCVSCVCCVSVRVLCVCVLGVLTSLTRVCFGVSR